MVNRKHILVLFCILATMPTGCKSKNADIDAILMANYLSTCPENSRYGIYDVNSDGVYELLVAENNSHVNGVDIITINPKSHELTNVGCFGSWGRLTCYPKTGRLISGYLNQGCSEDFVYEISDGEAKIVATFWDNSGTLDDVYEYKINDVLVSEEKYNEELIKYYSDEGKLDVGYDDFMTIRDYDTNVENIKSQMK